MTQRLGAGKFLLWSALSIVLWSVSVLVCCYLVRIRPDTSASTLNWLVSAVSTFFGIAFYSLSSRRLKDLNVPPWLVKGLAFPLLALIILPYLVLVPGPQFENDYGSAPRSSSVGVLFLAGVLTVVALLISFPALTTYAKTRYALESGRVL